MSDWQCSSCWTMYTFKEFIELPAQWVKPGHEEFGKTPICHCGAVFNRDVWQMLWFDDGYKISTIHLNIGNPDNIDWLNNDLMWFETMIFKPNGKPLAFQARYRTRAEAEEGHWLAVERLQSIILNPDAYPQSIMTSFMRAVSGNDKLQSSRIDDTKDMPKQQVVVEKEMTAADLLESKGLDKTLYIVSQEGKLVQGDSLVKVGVQADIIPAVKGG